MAEVATAATPEPEGRDGALEVQALAEGVELVDDRCIEFFGERFRAADRIGLVPLMKFALMAKQGATAADDDSLVAMYVLLRDCIDTTRPQQPVLEEGEPKLDEHGQPVTEDAGPSEWDRFEEHAIANKADAEDLLKVVGDAIALATARPTRRPSASSDGSPTISPSSNVPPRSSPSLPPLGEGAAEQVAELVSVADLDKARDARATRSQTPPSAESA